MKFGTITTKQDLKNMFEELCIRPGLEIMLHSSMRGLGYVVNGALDVIDALLELIGDEGTLLMPAHTGQLTDPADWRQPSIPEEYIETVRRSMRPFDLKTTPVRNRGIIAHTFLSYTDVSRSFHPLNSVAAKGCRATYFTEIHDLHESEGMNSPTGRLYEREGFVLLIGVTLKSCTAIHLAEYIADVPYLQDADIKVLARDDDSRNTFVRLQRYPGNSEFFDKLLPDMRSENLLKEVMIRSGHLLMFPIKPVVDLAVERLRLDPYYLVTP